jgi:SAM-dependent methyltransferase
MPSIEENKKKWGETYAWPHRGDEWSAPWGSPAMQWYGLILPRIHRFLPVQRILEIAPGHGRWTDFLRHYAEELMIVDLSESCIEACKARFSGDGTIFFHVNDGKSLDMARDDSVDFIFSFDSLVHADDAVLQQYVKEFAKKLSRDGVAFIHHSNLGEYGFQVKYSKIPKLRALLRMVGVLERNLHLRSSSMTARKMLDFCKASGLCCITQELVNWITQSSLTDCFSTVVRKDSKWARETRVFRNHSFMKDAENIKVLAHFYGE